MKFDLFLIRHAEAEEKELDQKDYDRGLTPDGIQDATRIGYFLQKEAINPDIIFSSSARRARATAILIAEQIKYITDQIHENSNLYQASIRILLETVCNLKDEWNTVFLVAHNPEISYLAEYLTSEEIGTLPSGSFVQIGFKLKSWAEVTKGSGSLGIRKSSPDFSSNEE